MDLERDKVDSDAQGRLLRYVYLDGAMVNAALIAVGLGSASTGQNVRYAEGFRPPRSRSTQRTTGHLGQSAQRKARRRQVITPDRST